MIIAAYQGPSVEGDIPHAFAKINETLANAAAQGATMVVFPELYLPGYNQTALHKTIAQPQGGEWEQQLSALAKKHGCGLTIGWAEQDGTIYNSASTFDASGEKLAHYRKIQLWGPIEQSTFAFGNSYTTFMLHGVKTALLICYDIEFPEHARALAGMGVKRIFVPTANPAGFGVACTTLVPARAVENGVTVVYANFCGTDAGAEFCGQTTIVGPDGVLLARASATDEALLFADLTQIDQIHPSLLSTQHADYRKVPNQ